MSAELLQDTDFRQGIAIHWPQFLQGRMVNRQQACIPQNSCQLMPAWSLQQWHSARSLAEATPENLPYGQQRVLQMNDQRVLKRVALTRHDADDHTTATVLLETDGLTEATVTAAGGKPQYLADSTQPWPHLLLSQKANPQRLSQYQHLPLSMQVRLLRNDPQIQPGYRQSLHAARLVLTMTVRNRLSGNYFWLNLPVYDDRTSTTPFGCSKCLDNGHCHIPSSLDEPGGWRCPEDRGSDSWWKDAKPGTGRMIFRMPSVDFVHGDLRQGDWVSVNGDLLPYIRAGIEAVRSHPGGRLFPHDLFFYEIGLFSIGWEITGFNHVAVELRDIRLQGLP